MAVNQKVTLYNNKFTVPPVINAVQNDTDRQVEAYFGDFTLQVGMTGKLSFIRSDGTHYEASATLSTANNTATAELDQALTQAGVTQAQLKITDSGNLGSTFTFMIKVQPDVAGISVPQDGWSAQEFDQRLTDAENAIDAVEEDVADLQDKEYDYAPVITDTASGAIASFPDGADGYPLKECVVNIEAVQSGSGDPSPDNVRPITGFSTAKVTRTGVNVWDEEWESGSLNSQTGANEPYDTRIRSKNYISVMPSTTYYFKTSGKSVEIRQYDLGKNFLGSTYNETKTDSTFTLSDKTYYIRFSVVDTTTYNNDISINYPSTDTDYHKGKVQTVTIDLGSTRYGGVLDVRRGKLIVDRVMYVFTGNESPYVQAGQNRIAVNIGITTKPGSAICSDFAEVVTANNLTYVYITTSMTVDELKDYMANHTVQCVYLIAQSIEVDVDPTAIKTVDGINNIWADCGDIEVEYCADTKLFIQKLISALA